MLSFYLENVAAVVSATSPLSFLNEASVSLQEALSSLRSNWICAVSNIKEEKKMKERYKLFLEQKINDRLSMSVDRERDR